jgi:hypothetical protein
MKQEKNKSPDKCSIFNTSGFFLILLPDLVADTDSLAHELLFNIIGLLRSKFDLTGIEEVMVWENILFSRR